MVEHTLNLDFIFGSLSDPTRRDILKRVAEKQLSVSEVAKPYKLTFAAVSKHLKVLENAKLIVKRRQGKEQLIQLSPTSVRDAADYLNHYQTIWNRRFDALEKLLINQLAEEKKPGWGKK